MWWIVMAVFFASLGLFLFGAQKRIEWLMYLTKPLLTASLLLFYTGRAESVDPLVVLALLGGLAGDVFLMLPERGYLFHFGLVSFLAGHICYILAFLEGAEPLNRLGGWFFPLAIPYVAAGILIFKRLKPNAGKLAPFVLAYIGVIIGMGLASLTTIGGAPGAAFLIPVAGSLLFIASDTCLAFARFTCKRCRTSTVMITYGLAQLLLTLYFTFFRGLS